MKHIIAAVAIAVAAPASAGTFGPYSELLVFGDSLSDAGNISNLTGGAFPDTTYYKQGQFTDGRTWASQLGSNLGDNFAFGGARAVDNTFERDENGAQTTVPTGDTVPDFFAQIGIFEALAATTIGDNPLTAIWFGGNDLRDIAFGLGKQSITIETALAQASTVAKTIAAGVVRLAETTRLDDFVVFSVPDISVVPGLSGGPLEEIVSDIAAYTNNVLLAELSGLKLTLPDVNVQTFDVNNTIRAIAGDPSIVGASISDRECLVQVNGVVQSYCGDENVSDYVFFDDIHPTDAAHALIAENFETQVIPLPGGMSLALGGFALLGFAARRKRAT